jgi:predicted transcriptional regulator
MNRTTISLPPELHKRLRVLAAERGVSMATLIREAVEEKAKNLRPKPQSIGAGDSGRTDISERTSDGLPELPDWR